MSSGTNGAGRAKCGYIRDGYTRREAIKESEWYPALHIEYRPMLEWERQVLFGRIREMKGSPVLAEQETAKALAEKVVWWDLCDDQGQLVEITPENILRVEPHLAARLFNVVAGLERGDAEKEAADAKNSAAG